MPFQVHKVNIGKHLLFLCLGWAGLLVFSAVVLPPLDSHIPPQPAIYWSVVTIMVAFALYTAIVLPAYLYQSWRKFAAVPNKTAYGIWLGFETLLLLAIPTWLAFQLVGRLFSGRSR